jgi:HSP20 family protein
MSKRKSTPVKATKPAVPASVEPSHWPVGFEEFERLFERWWPQNWAQPWSMTHPLLGEISRFELRTPKVDIIDRDGEVVVWAEVPGIDKDKLDISLTENSVTLRGESRHEKKEEHGSYFRNELRCGAFSRTVGLPCHVDTGKARASFKDGVVELILPKLAKAKRVNLKVQ